MDFLEPYVFIFAIIQLFRNKTAGPILIMLCMFDSFNVIGTNKSDFLFPHHYSDDGFILFVILIFVLSFRRVQKQVEKFSNIKRGIIIFLFFILIAAIVDIAVNNIRIVSIFRIIRVWVCLPLLWFLKYIKPKEIRIILNYLLIFSVVLALSCIFEHLFDLTLFGAHRMSSDNRAAIPWVPTFLVFILLINNYYRISTRIKWICITIILVLLVLCGSRSLFIAYLAAFMITAFFKESRMTLKKIVLSTLSLGLALVIFTTDNIISQRFSEASEDFGGLQRTNAVVEGNFSFRILLLTERMAYINTNPQYMLFGIGFIPEDGLHKQIFRIGLVNREENKIIQLDTGDIAWAPMFLRYGYLGSIIFILFFYIPFWKTLHKHRKNNAAAYSAAIFMMIHLLVISFTYTHINKSYMYLLPMLILVLCGRQIGEEKGNNESR